MSAREITEAEAWTLSGQLCEVLGGASGVCLTIEGPVTERMKLRYASYMAKPPAMVWSALNIKPHDRDDHGSAALALYWLACDAEHDGAA